MTNNLIVLCKDCKHQINRDCHRNRPDDGVDIVSGKRRRPIYPFCSYERSAIGSCGVAAEFFEPKKKWWKL